MGANHRGLAVSILLVAVAIVATAILTQSFASATTQDPLLFDLVEELRIVSDESSPQTSLTAVNGLTVLSDGSIVTAHASESLIRVYNPDGTFARAFGRRGVGPGEISMLFRLGSVGDSVWVDDLRNRQLYLFSKTGQFLRSIQLPAVERASGGVNVPATMAGGAYPVIVGLLPGRRSLLQRTFRGPAPAVGSLGQPDSASFIVQDSVGRVITRLLDVRIAGRPDIQGPLASSISQPFTARAEASIAPGAARFLIASDAEIWGGQPGQLRLSELSSDGRLTHRVVSLPPIRISANFADSLVKRVTNSVLNTIGRGRTLTPREIDGFEKDVRAKLHVPAFFHVNSGANLLGRDGSLWLKYQFPDKSWVVIVDARLTMRVRVPDGVRLYQVSRERVWGVKTDSLGLPIILRYRVVQRG